MNQQPSPYSDYVDCIGELATFEAQRGEAIKSIERDYSKELTRVDSSVGDYSERLSSTVDLVQGADASLGDLFDSVGAVRPISATPMRQNVGSLEDIGAQASEIGAWCDSYLVKADGLVSAFGGDVSSRQSRVVPDRRLLPLSELPRSGSGSSPTGYEIVIGVALFFMIMQLLFWFSS